MSKPTVNTRIAKALAISISDVLKKGNMSVTTAQVRAFKDSFEQDLNNGGLRKMVDQYDSLK